MPDKSQTEINRELHDALFGSEGRMGVVEKTDEIYQILSAFRLFGKAVMWVALFIGAVGVAASTLWGSVKYFFQHFSQH